MLILIVYNDGKYCTIKQIKCKKQRERKKEKRTPEWVLIA